MGWPNEPFLNLRQTDTPRGTPANGGGLLYLKDDGALYLKDASGTETLAQQAVMDGLYRPYLIAEGPGIDPTGATNSLAAIQAMVNSLAATGGVLEFPRGTYLLAGDLTVNADAIALNGGGEGTLLNFSGGGVLIDGSVGHTEKFTMAGFSIQRSGTAGPALYLKGGGAGTGVDRFGIRDVHVLSSTGPAIRIDGSYIGVFTNCYGRSSTIGLDIEVDVPTGTVSGNLLTFVGCEFQSNTKAALVNGTAGVTFVGCGFEGNTTEGVELADNARAVTFINPYFEANGGYDIKVGTTTAAITPRILGGYFANGSTGKTGSIYVIKSEGFGIDGAMFSGYGASSPVQINEAASGTAKGYARNCWSNGTASIVALNGATQWGAQVVGREGSVAIKNVYRASAVLDFPSIAAGGSANLTISVPGAAVGDDATVHYNGTPPAGINVMAWVSAADTVTIRATNTTAAAIDPAAATIRTIVWKF